MSLLPTKRSILCCLWVLGGLAAARLFAAETGSAANATDLSTHQAKQQISAPSVSFNSVSIKKKSIEPNHRQLVAPLLELAATQLSNKEDEAAKATLLKCISVLESEAGIFDEAFIEPLSRLGRIHQEQGQHEKAIEYIRQAKHITHRNKGLYNLEQIELIDALSESYRSLGRIRDAEREQWYAYGAYEHHHGNNIAGLIPAIFRLTDWYRRIGDFRGEYYVFNQAVSILQATKREHDVDVVNPLRVIASNYALLGVTDRLGERALEQALEIVERNPEAMPFQYAEVLIDLGDWYLINGNTEKALDFYKRTWSFVSSHEQLTGQAEEVFRKPMVLSSGKFGKYRLSEIRPQPGYQLQSYYGWSLPQHLSRGDATLFGIGDQITNNGPKAVGYVDVLVTVGKEGGVSDVEVLQKNIEPHYRDGVLSNLNQLRFRPRFENGEATVTKQFRSRLTFVDTRRL